jgi:putative ABC transport system permease protein
MFGQALVVVQFSFSVLLIVASIVLFTQMKFVKTKDLGYQPDQVIKTSIPGNRILKPIREFLKNEVAKEPAIIQIAFGGDAGTYNTQVNDREIKTTYRRIDSSYLKTLGIKLKEGNNFQNGKVDEAIVNEAFVKAAGLKNPVGQIAKAAGEDRLYKITGVVKDFHFGSLKDRIQPLIMYQDLEASGDVWVKFEQAQQEKALSAFEKIYKKVIPDTYYEYKFLTELNAREYQQEQRWETLISYATVLSLSICCFGLFGLSGLSIQQRVKEIGVRKVLGASIMQITSLLSWQFLKLVIIAFVIAAPISWWATHEWLQNFAYRIEVSWWIFGLAGIGAIFIALMTISHHAIKAAIANPVKSLRTE